MNLDKENIVTGKQWFQDKQGPVMLLTSHSGFLWQNVISVKGKYVVHVYLVPQTLSVASLNTFIQHYHVCLSTLFGLLNNI